MSIRPRDSQRAKLYKSERPLKRWHRPLFKNRRAIQSYAKRILKHKWFRERWPHVASVNVRKIRSDARAHGWYSGGGVVSIQIPKTRWAMIEAVVLHEIAHGLTEYEFGISKTAWHGPEFAKIYVALVQHYMGREAARDLRRGYREHRVKYRSNGHG